MRSVLTLLTALGFLAAAAPNYGQAVMKNNQWQMALNRIPRNSPDFDPDEGPPDAGLEIKTRTPNVGVFGVGMRNEVPSKDGKWITFTLGAVLKNESYRQIAEVDIVGEMIETSTKKVLYQTKPVVFRSFDNLQIPRIGTLAPYALEDNASVGKYKFPIDLWRTDTYVSVRVVNVLPVTDERNLHDIGNVIALFARVHNADIERILLKDPSILKVKDSQGITPALVAAGACTPRLERFIIAHGGNLNAKNIHGEDAMYYAASFDNVKMLEFCQAHGLSASPKSCDPLMIATKTDSYNAVTWLVTHGADINRRDSKGDTAIGEAIQSRQYQSFRVLLAAKPNLHVYNKQGFGLMHLAAHTIGFLPRLVAAGLSVDDPMPSTGETPLMSAASTQNNPIAKWLLDHGAKLYAKDKKGRNVFDYARKSNTLGTDRFFRDFFHNDFSKYGGKKG